MGARYFLEELVRRPKKAMKYGYWRTAGKLHCMPSRAIFDDQRKKIRKLAGEEKFLLVILDACRYDYFDQERSHYFEGDLETVYSSGRNTFEYVSKAWSFEGSNEVRYISGAIPVNSEEDKERYIGDFAPKNNLDIRDVWSESWDEEKKTCPPEEVTEAAREELPFEDKLVAHYYQPHSPMVGYYDLFDEIREVTGEGSFPDFKLWQMLRSGEIPVSKVKKAYRSNLRKTMEGVRELVDQAGEDRKIVVTADHGELFGEGGNYAHPPVDHPKLRQVPWLEVEEISEGSGHGKAHSF